MFSPKHVLSMPGDASVLVEMSVQDGTEPWYKLYTALEDDDALFILRADGKVCNSYTGEVLDGARVERF